MKTRYKPLKRLSLLYFLAHCQPVTTVEFPDIDDLLPLDEVVF